nr:hypothetical protein [Pseudomonadota bacterium]
MQYLKSVMEAKGVQTLVNENDAIINNLVNQTITDITTENITIVRDNLEQFIVEGDLLETYEDISTWASEDVQYYMEAISEVLADQELTQEQKVAIISNPDQFLSTEIKSGSFGSAYSAARKGDDYQAKTKRERAGKVVGKGVKAVTGAGK